MLRFRLREHQVDGWRGKARPGSAGSYKKYTINAFKEYLSAGYLPTNFYTHNKKQEKSVSIIQKSFMLTIS